MAGRMKEFPGNEPTARGDRPEARGSAPVFNAPPVVSWLAVFIIACHVVFLLLPAGMQMRVSVYAGLSPHDFLTGGEGPLRRFAPLVGHMLLHGGWLHLAFNCMWLMAFGAPVARRLGADLPYGAARASILFLLLFTLSGVVGALFYVALHPGDTTMLIGASGGVSGLLGGLVRFAFRRPPAAPGDVSGLFEKPVVAWTAAVVGLNLAMGVFGADLSGDGADIAWEAHIGGYFFGLLTFPLFARRRRGF
jgi:membrane associated rhomboid family serine protease